jgi:hypothetical protein
MPLCRSCHSLFHAVGEDEFYLRTRVDVRRETQQFRMVVEGSAPVHSGRCNLSQICNACQNAAESAWERYVSRGP